MDDKKDGRKTMIIGLNEIKKENIFCCLISLGRIKARRATRLSVWCKNIQKKAILIEIQRGIRSGMRRTSRGFGLFARIPNIRPI
jgi:hypothetical protein